MVLLFVFYLFYKMTLNKANLPAVRFSHEEDEVLIDFVQNHPILYDLKNTEFKNTLKKKLIWKEAGTLIKKEGSECKKRWKSIRDHYKREKKEEKDTTGKAAKKKRAMYWERLQFLDSVEEERQLKPCLEDILQQLLQQEDENEIDLFFKTMAATVKKFRADLATRTKARVFNVVTEMELLNQQLTLPPTTENKSTP